jgi:radical SAM protein with 4Fe4S-binding SPASM domain
MESIVEEALTKGFELHKAGQIDLAKQLYSSVIKIEPRQPDANHNLGIIEIDAGKGTEAKPLLRIALEVNPDNAQYWVSYIDLLIRLEEFSDAQYLLTQAIDRGAKGALFDQLEQRLEQLITTFSENDKNSGVSDPAAKAAKDLEPSQALRSQSKGAADTKVPSKGQLTRLVEHYQNGRFSKAETLAISLTHEFPKHQLSWKVLGVIFGQTGRKVEASNANQTAVALSPQDAEAHSNLGNSLQELCRLEEAETSYKQAIALKPDFAQAHYNLGITLQELGRSDEAEASYMQATALTPDFAEAHGNLGITLQELGRLEEAEASLRQAIELKPDFAEANYNLGITLQELGRLDEAEVSYTQAISLKSDYSEAHSNLGNTLKELGRLDEAEASLRQAIELKPDFAEANYNLGITLKELGRLDEAEVSYTQAISLKPDYAEAHRNLGITLQKLGRLEEAVSSFQKAFIQRTGIRPVGDEVLAPATTTLLFELTNKCNFHCTFCPSDSQTRDIGSMDVELVKRLYKEAADKKIDSVVNLHLMGEPTLHPKLIEILNFGASKNIKTGLVTNGSTLVAKVVPKILDSMYGTITASHMTPTEETYHFRGEVKLSWDRYISNLRLLVREYMKRLAKEAAIKCDIVIRVMATQNTASNVTITDTPNEARAILKEWNDFVAEVEQELGMIPFKRKDHNADDLLQENLHNSISYPLQNGIKLTFWRAFTFANTRVSDDFELETCKETAYCTHPFTDVGVLWNGDVTLCCLDHDGELSVGNVKDSSLETVIQSETARKLRASMLGDHPLPSVCQTCQAKPVRREDAH